MRLLGLWLAVTLGLAGESVTSPLFFIQDSPGHYLIRVPGMTAVFTPQGAEFQAVHMTFLGASSAPDLHGLDPMGSANFLVGQDPNQWRTGLPTFQKILYSNLYPGIDLLYSGKNGRVKSEFTTRARRAPQ